MNIYWFISKFRFERILKTIEVFKVVMGESSKVIEGVDYSGLEEKIKYAAESCPAEVIKYEES